MKNKLFLLLLFGYLSFTAHAQEIVVEGTVLSEDNLPIPGVTVVIKGTSKGSATDFDGIFSIKADSNDILVFSYVGYNTQEIQVTGSEPMTVILKESISTLDQVVVVAYGTQSKRSLTGAVVEIKAEEIVNQPVTNFTNSLQGAAPGLQTFNSSGQPGASASFLIRGIGSASAGTEPLIVVDGIIYPASLSTINPNDIESISVLKDAASASLYGSRAANGVITITTKAGRKNQKISYTLETSVGVSERTNPNDFRVANTAEYIEYYREAVINSGGNPSDPNAGGLFLPIDQPFDTNWVDEAFRSGFINNYDFSVRGGNENTSLFASLGYAEETGIVIATGFERITGLLKIEHQANKRFKFGGSAQITYRDRDNVISNGRAGQLSGAFQTAPIEPIFATPDLIGTAGEGAGFNFAIPSNASHNPVASAALNSNNEKTYTINSIVNADYEFTDWLKADIKVSHLLEFSNERESTSKLYRAENQGGTTEESRTSRNVTTLSGSLRYSEQFGNDHLLSAQLGGEMFRQRFNGLSASANNFTFDNINNVGLGGVATAEDIGSDFNGLSTVGFFARLKYSFKDKIFLELSGRRDGASNFGPDNRWGNFGAIGASYIVSEDLFQNSSFLDLLKLRVSYGSSGNNNIGNFGWRDLYDVGVNSVSPSGNVYNGVLITSPSNSELKWEKNLQLDLGLDFALFNNRISGSVDFFTRSSQDLLFDIPLSQTTGFDENTVNSTGEFGNTGMEFDVSWYNIRGGNFTWRSNFNYAFYDQEIKVLPDGDVVFDTRIWSEGGRSDNWFIQQYAGVDPLTGTALYYDADGNITSTPSSDNRVVVGQRTPDSYGSFTNTLTYKDLSFSFTFYGSFGSDGYFDLGQDLGGDGINFPANFWTYQLNRWQQIGDITDVPRADINGNTNVNSTRFLYDESYVRLQNVNLHYSLPGDIEKRLGVNDVSFNISGQNLWVFTNWPGYDPTSETYPVPRILTMGASVTF